MGIMLSSILALTILPNRFILGIKWAQTWLQMSLEHHMTHDKFTLNVSIFIIRNDFLFAFKNFP